MRFHLLTFSPSHFLTFKTMRNSLIIVGFFIVGTVVGVFNLVPVLSPYISDVSFYALCALMFFVGVSVGSDAGVLRSIRSVNPRLLLLPLVTITGTLGGVALAAWLFPRHSLTDCLAVGSGFGYYSLSSIFITEYRGAALGTVALLANIARELIALLCAPLLVRWFGRYAPISVAGATSMDTTLPVITLVSGRDVVVLSVFHGFLVDFSVPFLVTFFCAV